MRKKIKKLHLHHTINNHITNNVNKGVHKIFHIHHNFQNHILHMGELIIITLITLISWTWLFANLTWFNEELYRYNNNEIATALLEAMQDPSTSLKQWNLISIRKMDTNVENTFTKWYCTYGAARISPEFFPYIDTNTQTRTWWGNAVDRCKNAADTGYKVWMTPSQWALVIYDAGWRFWAYGHVGKVMHYEKELKKIIIRDMARVGKSTMSDRWEDITTAQIKCYIYNNKNTEIESTPPETTSPTVEIPPTLNSPTIPPPPTFPSLIPPVQAWWEHLAPTLPADLPSSPLPPTITTPPTTSSPSTLDKWLYLHLDNINDIAKHFISQNDLKFSLLTKSPLQVWEIGNLNLEITNKRSWKKYSGLLPFSFWIISTNSSLKTSIGNIKFVNEWKTNISILAEKLGKSSIIITMDDIKISEFTLEVQ